MANKEIEQQYKGLFGTNEWLVEIAHDLDEHGATEDISVALTIGERWGNHSSIHFDKPLPPGEFNIADYNYVESVKHQIDLLHLLITDLQEAQDYLRKALAQ